MHSLSVALLALVALGSTPSPVPAQQSYSYEDLLARMTEMDWLWQRPQEGERCIQFSSYDRRSDKGPDDHGAWFANGDHGKYLRVEEHNGKKEHVLVDVDGPGCVVRIWSANPKGKLFFYVDEATQPTYSVGLKDLTSGKLAPFLEPLAGMRAKGCNCHVPFPFQKHLKITSSDGDFYYQVNVRLFGEGVRLPSFEPEFLERHARALERTRLKLSQPPTAGSGAQWRKDLATVSVQSGGETSLFEQNFSGPGVMRHLRLRARPKNGMSLQGLLRVLLLVIRCDGSEVVRVPVSDFFGSAPAFAPYGGLAVGVTEDGTGYCTFPMPARKKIQVRIESQHRPLSFELEFETLFSPQALPPGNLAFHASWHQVRNLKTRPFSHHLVLDAKGPGRFVGCTLVVRNPVKTWWGEGDEKFFVDGESFPSTFGTGTEDYFGYAWCSPKLFSHAYHAQTQCDGPKNFGYTCVNRFQIPDQVPFQKSFRFDLEVWHWKQKITVDYASTAYWYAPPAASSGLPPVVDAATRLPEKIEPIKQLIVADALEGEDLKTDVMTAGKREAQGTSSYEAQWSRDKHLWWQGAKVGDRLVLRVPVETAGRYTLRARFTKANDYGIFQVSMNGQKLRERLDLYNRSVVLTKEMKLGTIDLEAGEQKLEILIVGKNPKAAAKYMFGLDYIRLLNRD